MTVSPPSGVRSADIVGGPEAPLDTEPSLAPREADDDVGLRTPTVAALPSVLTPTASAHHTITELAEQPSVQESPGATDAPDAPDEPGAPEASGEPQPGRDPSPGSLGRAGSPGRAGSLRSII